MIDTTDWTDEDVRGLATLMVLTLPMELPHEAAMADRVRAHQQRWERALVPWFTMLFGDDPGGNDGTPVGPTEPQVGRE